MANKLKNLIVTNVDLVDQGANPDAHIRLFKRRDGAAANEPTEEEKSLFRKFADWLKRGYENAQEPAEPDGNVQKEARTFGNSLSRETMRKVTEEMYDLCYALSDSLSSIICDNEVPTDKKQTMMAQSVKEFAETMSGAVASWASGNRVRAAEEEAAKAAGIQKSAAQQAAMKPLLIKRGLAEPETEVNKAIPQKEESDTMKIDKSKMTPEELAVLEGFEKKYGAADSPESKTAPEGVSKGAEAAGTPDAGTENELHPDVRKALSDMRAAYDAQTKQVEALQKSLEVERLTQTAKKYEPLGKKADELAAKMYDLKKAGGTVYDDYVALLDENLAMLGKSRLFGEIGSSRQGSAGTEESIGIKAAEIAKSANGGMAHADAVIKAFEQNPELAAQYEQEYMGR